MKRTGLTILAMGLFLFAQAARADWTPAKRLTWTSGLSYMPAVVIDSAGNPHVFWQDDTPGKPVIYYRNSTDGGASWTAIERLVWTAGNSFGPAAAVDSLGRLHVVWYDDSPGNSEIYYKRSTDEGASWTVSKRLTWTTGYSLRPAIAVDASDCLHIVWQENTPLNREIYYKKSTDGGSTWTSFQRLTWTSSYSEGPAVAVDSSNKPHLVWHDATPGNWQVYYKKSADGGASWTTSERLTFSSGNAYVSAIVTAAPNQLHVIYYDYSPGNAEIYYRKSTNGGTSWLTRQRLTWNSGSSGYADLARDAAGNLHVVWQDNTSGNEEIYYKKSTDGGTTWANSLRLTRTSGGSYYPSIAADLSGNLYVVWEDGTPGNGEIYYKKFVK
jgi:BNR repeat-like domain